MEEEIKDLEVSHTPGKGRYRILLLPLSGHIEYSLTTPQTKTILLSLRPLFLLTSYLKWHFLLQWLFLVASPASILHPEISIRILNFLLLDFHSSNRLLPLSTRGGSWLTQTSQDTTFFAHSHLPRSGHVT